MRLALITREGKLEFIEERIKEELPDAQLVHWPEDGALEAEIAICWNPEHGTLASMPNLKLIHSIGAGVDNLLADRDLPDLPVCRIRDDDLSLAMAEYVHWGTLWFQRQFDRLVANAARGAWERLAQRPAAEVTVGILGLGTIGRKVAERLVQAGYPVLGWARHQNDVPGVTCFVGEEGLHDLLSRAQVLVSLLPLTPETLGILNCQTLSRLPKGAGLILCSRGQHLVTDDLVALLRSGHLRGAILDVFSNEPLPATDPLWFEPGVLVTPHMSALTKPRRIAEQIALNVKNLEQGLPLENEINRQLGY